MFKIISIFSETYEDLLQDPDYVSFDENSMSVSIDDLTIDIRHARINTRNLVQGSLAYFDHRVQDAWDNFILVINSFSLLEEELNDVNVFSIEEKLSLDDLLSDVKAFNYFFTKAYYPTNTSEDYSISSLTSEIWSRSEPNDSVERSVSNFLKYSESMSNFIDHFRSEIPTSLFKRVVSKLANFDKLLEKYAEIIPESDLSFFKGSFNQYKLTLLTILKPQQRLGYDPEYGSEEACKFYYKQDVNAFIKYETEKIKSSSSCKDFFINLMNIGSSHSVVPGN
jgi:hypothetical protein